MIPQGTLQVHHVPSVFVSQGTANKTPNSVQNFVRFAVLVVVPAGQ